MGRTVYTATLTDPLHRSLAQAALEHAGVTDAAAGASALADHAACYPPDDPGADTWLEPLYPDRLGEDFVALTTPGHTLADYTADLWAERAPARLLIHDNDESPPYTRPVVTALIETARRWPHIAETLLNPLLREQPQIAVNAGGSALVGLADLPGVERDVLEAVENKLPGHRHVDLDIGIAVLAARLTALRLAETDDASLKANLYHALGKRFANAGLNEEALTVTAKAVEIREQLATEKPGTCEPDLALSLNNLGKVLSDQGDHERALTVTGRAIDVYRQLARTGHDPDEAGLARALNNRAAVLSVLGRPEDALAAIEEAAEIRRRLTASDAAAHEPDLALTVDNLAVILRRLGRREQALTASSSAVDTWRRLERFPLRPPPADTEDVAALAAWRDDPAKGVSVLLMHGPGGQGETGLAARFAVESAESHWTVWAACRVSDPSARTAMAPSDPGQALVTIVECAERWPADDLQLLVQSPLLRIPTRARVLLIARSAGSWWPTLRHRLSKADITVGGTLSWSTLKSRRQS